MASLQDMVTGGPATLYIPAGIDNLAARILIGTHDFVVWQAGWSPHRVDYLLYRFGIQSYGRRFRWWRDEQGDRVVYVFGVSTKQARWAEYIMCCHGIYPLLGGRIITEADHKGSLPKPWQPGRECSLLALWGWLLIPLGAPLVQAIKQKMKR